MASKNDYPKPKNKELQGLVWNFPFPLRVKSPAGNVLWQNRSAESGTWPEDVVEQKVSWQNRKAVLEVPNVVASSDTKAKIEELEEEVLRLKRLRRQTARKKRQAETALHRQEKQKPVPDETDQDFKKRLARLHDENEKLLRKLTQSQADAASRQNDKKTLETWVEELESKAAEREAAFSAQAAEMAALREEFRKFREATAEENAERLLEQQLAAKVAEFEQLERTLEEEQQTFDRQRRELQQKLQSQEADLAKLKVGVEQHSERSKAVPQAELEELSEELTETRADLELAERREKRLQDKIGFLEEMRDEHSKVLALFKEDVEEGKKREAELKDTLKLYRERHRDSEQSLEELKTLRATVDRLEGSEKVLRAELALAQAKLETRSDVTPRESSSVGSLSVSVKNQLDFLKKRLGDTEKELDEARRQIKLEKAENQSSKESERLAYRDTLTGLPNRNMADRFLSYAHEKGKANDSSLAVFLIDLDGFRVLNTTYGRDWGDSLLKAVGERLNAMRGASHLFVRHSQDRFVLLAGDIEKAGARAYVENASKSLLEALAYPFEVRGEEVRLSGTLGVSLGPLSGDNSLELYDYAEMALDRAKGAGPGRYLLFDGALLQARQKESTYEQQMGHAIEKDEFTAVFQPVFHLSQGIVLGLELYTRWAHREQRVLQPAEFLEAAIKSGQIFQITEKVWPKAFLHFAKWRKMRPGLTLSLNLCDKELLSPTLLKNAVSWVRAAGLEPKSVIFEVRDQSRLRMSAAWWRILEEYHRAGFGLCLDDFASDSSLYGTLAYHGFTQAKMRVDDKIPHLSPAPQARKGILYGAKRLGDRFDKRALIKAGFHLAQGYAVSQPLDYSEVDGLFS